MLVYDIEIIRAIPPRKGQWASRGVDPNVWYCDGWNDHANMGVSCVCAYDYWDERDRVFCRDNLQEFVALTEKHDVLVGFNNIRFDNAVLDAVGIPINNSKCYDLLREIWTSQGLGTSFVPKTHGGFGLGAVARANGLPDKTGYGGDAPAQWQRGEIGTVIDYCLHDVWLTRKLLDRVIASEALTNPKNGGAMRIKAPNQAVTQPLFPTA